MPMFHVSGIGFAYSQPSLVTEQMAQTLTADYCLQSSKMGSVQ